MILNIIEKQRAQMLTVEHPFIADARMSETQNNKARNDSLQVHAKVSSEMKLSSHTFTQYVDISTQKNN